NVLAVYTDRYSTTLPYTTLFRSVSLNTAITLIRKKKRNVMTSSIDSQSYFDIKASESDKEKEEQLKVLYRAIKKLNDVERALVLLYLEDMSYKEIASTMGISEVNARVKMSRIRVKLKELMTLEE